MFLSLRQLPLALAFCFSASAFAVDLDLPSLPLEEALLRLGVATGCKIEPPAGALARRLVLPVRGDLSIEEALRQMLVGSGLTVEQIGPGQYRIIGQAHLLREVEVKAKAETAYAVRDIGVAGKSPQTMREIPQSVSVLTRAQMDDQNMVTTWDALAQMTGITAISNDGSQAQYHARGGALELQHDGVPSSMPLSGYQQFDLAIYDRIEVLRGPAGLLQGSGSFSGTVNLVRKRPKDVFAAEALVAAGSWDNYRVEADVSTPLTEDGRLKGRVVLSAVERDFYYDRVHEKKWLGYGILEWAPTAASTIALSVAHQDDRSPGFSGLPTYTNGRHLDVPRSFNPYPDWNRTWWTTTDTALDLKHHFDSDWVVQLKAGRREQKQFFRDSFAWAGVDPATMTVGEYARREYEYKYTLDSFDANASGPFELLGRRHTLLIGANASRFHSAGEGAAPAGYVVYDVPLADPPAVPEPDFVYNAGSERITEQSGIYGQLRLSLADPLTVVLGGRTTDYASKSRSVAPSTPTAWSSGGKERGHFTPYFGALYDFAPGYTLYASQADIFVPQTQLRADGSVLEPREGRQHEVGVKGEFLGGRVNASLAAFRIRDTNRAYADPTNTGFYLPMGEVESKGWEAELVGSLAPGWELSAGYTRLDTRYIKHQTLAGTNFNYWYPRHTFKLWSNYRVQQGALAGFSFGVGVQAASKSASGASTATVAAREQGQYAVVNTQVGYRLDKHLALSLALNNVFDTKYYTRLGGTNTYNTYGDPRNVMLTLRATY